MKQIRLGTFETNSSSTHSLIICTEDQYDKLGSKYFIDCDSNMVVTKEEAINKLKANHEGDENFDKLSDEDMVCFINNGYLPSNDNIERDWDDPVGSFGDWAGEYLELDKNSFTTPSGDKMVAICKYGYDS